MSSCATDGCAACYVGQVGCVAELGGKWGHGAHLEPRSLAHRHGALASRWRHSRHHGAYFLAQRDVHLVDPRRHVALGEERRTDGLSVISGFRWTLRQFQRA